MKRLRESASISDAAPPCFRRVLAFATSRRVCERLLVWQFLATKCGLTACLISEHLVLPEPCCAAPASAAACTWRFFLTFHVLVLGLRWSTLQLPPRAVFWPECVRNAAYFAAGCAAAAHRPGTLTPRLVVALGVQAVTATLVRAFCHTNSQTLPFFVPDFRSFCTSLSLSPPSGGARGAGPGGAAVR